MIIDAHAHGWQPKLTADTAWWTEESLDNSEALLGEMDRHGVTKTVLQMAHTTNEQIQSTVRKHPDRFVGFCTWQSAKLGRSGNDAADEIQRWLKEPEFKGVGEVVLYRFGKATGAKGSHLTYEDLMRNARPVMDVVASFKVPILFHTGFSGGHSGKASTPLLWRDPIYLDELAGEYPEVPIILGHSGGFYPPHDMNALMVAYNNDNVYLETSKSRTDVIEQAVKEIGSSKILFGTDWISKDPMPLGPMSERPCHLHDRNIGIVREARISNADKENIFYKNIKSLLDL